MKKFLVLSTLGRFLAAHGAVALIRLSATGCRVHHQRLLTTAGDHHDHRPRGSQPNIAKLPELLRP